MLRSKGFSIVEVIITITIISVIGVFTSNLLTRTYRSSSDTELLSKLKQNGEVASNNIGEAIRMADSVVCYGQNGLRNDRIVIRTIEGKYWLFRFVDPEPPTGSPVTKNGYILKQENLNPRDFADFCIINPPNFSEDIIITDFDNSSVTTGVSISQGNFVKSAGPAGKDTVTIKFDVGQAGLQPGSQGTVTVQTTVQVR
ncbi:MAG TPA: prepilin-type N-terminal cleavage/methylation domain-containing protein [Patescibacteria group bacterium]|nr:prepilin-type N-terminal cleavage/methylation domain-containing protein [Patescibacteria group bacterium]